MRNREFIAHFLNHSLLLGGITFFIIYFIVFDNIEVFFKIGIALIPIGIFVAIAYIHYQINYQHYRRLEDTKTTDITIALDYFDIIIADLVTYLVPISILLIALFSKNGASFTDLAQAIIAYFLVLFWQKTLFSRRV